MSKPTTMQDFGNYCDSMVENQDITLKDTRDGNSYIVTKLKDNRCWMTENLRIIGKDITPSDSDVSEDFSIPTSALWTDTSGNTNHAYYDPEYGGYYTLHTASAGTGNIFQGTIPSSICPKGWKMPSGGSGSELPALLNAYNVSNNSDGAKILMSEPLNFALSGYVNYSNGSLTGQGIYGYYRTSTVYWSASTFHLKIMNNTATTSHDYQGYGYSIRCLAREAVG